MSERSDFQTPGEIEAKTGITPGALTRARRFGLLIEHKDWKRGTGHWRGFLYSLKSVQIASADIRVLKGRRRPPRKSSARRPAWDRVDSEEKQRIAKGIRDAQELEVSLRKQLEDVYKVRSGLEKQFWNLLWNRPDCPYCKGSGVLHGLTCRFCDVKES